ncbi:MAG: hypothetical protein ACREN6_17730 [Gemmatimonadaceae bacterium]
MALLGGTRVRSAVAAAKLTPGTWCYDFDGTAKAQVVWLKSMATATSPRDTTFRGELRLMPIDPSAVAFVADSVACRRAAESLRRAEVGADTGELASISLIRYGSMRYVGASQKPMSEWQGWIVFDTSFAPLASVVH